VTIISLKELYYTLWEEGTDLRSLNAQWFVVLELSCVAKCMPDLNDKTEGSQTFLEKERGNGNKLLRL
jgi:hypothetical protein